VLARQRLDTRADTPLHQPSTTADSPFGTVCAAADHLKRAEMTVDNWVESMDSYRTLAKTGKLVDESLSWHHTCGRDTTSVQLVCVHADGLHTPHGCGHC